MNTPHEHTLDDAAVISRLRDALDEVTAEPVAARPAAGAAGGRSAVSAGRWLAIAAAVALIGGGITAIVVNRNHQGGGSSADSTPTVPTEPSLIRTVVPWFTLAAANLAPGEITHPSSELSPDTAMYQAWRVQGDGSDGFLFASAYFTGDGAAPIVDEGGTVEELADVPDGQAWLAFEPAEGDQFVAPSLWWARSDGSTWVFQQQGLYSAVSDNQWVDLVFAAQPGSGVPIVLPDPRATLLIVGSGNGTIITQPYTGVSGGSAELTVSDGPASLAGLIGATDVSDVTVAGHAGWKAVTSDGKTIVVWDAGDGYWGLLVLSAELAEQADGIITGIAQVDGGEAGEGDPTPVAETVPVPPAVSGGTDPVITGDALPAYTSEAGDAAVGTPAPAVVGYDFDGAEVTINPAEGAHLVVFAAHWCPHCNAELPRLIDAIGNGTIPAWLPVTLVSTAEAATWANYPADDWLASKGWTGRTIQDGSQGEGAAGTIAEAYGTTGFPYFVLIDGNGNVAARASGEMDVEQIGEFVSTLQGPTAIARLQIPSIDVDLTVVSPGDAGLNASQQSPVLIAGPVPGTDGDIGVVWGHSTMYGGPFARLDELQAGDTMTWTDEGVTVTFEVISVATSDDPDAGGVPDGTTLQLRIFTPEDASQQVLVVFARTIA